MITIGYGDIVPVTPDEKIFGICVAFVACGVFAYSFSYIGKPQMIESSNITMFFVLTKEN